MDGDGSRFSAGRQVDYRSSRGASDAWTSILWFRSDAMGQTLPILRISTALDVVLSVYAEISNLCDCLSTKTMRDQNSRRIRIA